MTFNGTSATAARPANTRVDWVDYAKGICVVMVVMMHSVLGVEQAAGQTGFMHALVAFAKPFRMPDFFLISGLFLSLVIDRDWRTYLDRKVVHFAYFYVLWVTIQFGFKAPAFAAETIWTHAGYLYLESFVEPFGPHIGGHQRIEPRLEDRDFAAAKCRDLALVLVHTGDLVAEIRKAGARNQSHIAGANHGNSHGRNPLFQWLTRARLRKFAVAREGPVPQKAACHLNE